MILVLFISWKYIVGGLCRMIPQFNRAESARVIPVFHSTRCSAIGAVCLHLKW